MNGTDFYLLHQKKAAHRSIPAFFLRYLTALAFGFTAAYFLYSFFQPSVCITATDISTKAGSVFWVFKLFAAQKGALIALFLLGMSAFTTFCHPMSVLLCVWRGVSLGCTVSSVRTGLLSIAPEPAFFMLTVSLMATIFFALLSSYSILYADCLLHAAAVCDRDAFFSLAREYVLCFLTLSGGVLASGVLLFVFM